MNIYLWYVQLYFNLIINYINFINPILFMGWKYEKYQLLSNNFKIIMTSQNIT